MKTLPEIEKTFGADLVTLNNGRSGLRRCLAVTAKAVADSTDPVMDFIATSERVDRYDEVIQLAGWDLKDYLRNPVVVDCHDYSSIQRILGQSTELTIKGGQMTNRVKFAVDNPLGLLAWKLAQGGFLRAESVGFMPHDWTDGMRGSDQPARTFTQQSLLEISLVVVPANADAVRSKMGDALKQGAINRAELRAVADCLQSLCTEPAEPRSHARAAGSGFDAAQLLQIAEINNTLRGLGRA